MAKQEKEKNEMKKEMEEKKEEICKDKNCPKHGSLSVRGRIFKGYIKKIVSKRAVVEWERLIYYRKYERYSKAKSRIHAHLPDCLADKIKTGDYVRVGECKPISKITHFVVLSKTKEE